MTEPANTGPSNEMSALLDKDGVLVSGDKAVQMIARRYNVYTSVSGVKTKENRHLEFMIRNGNGFGFGLWNLLGYNPQAVLLAFHEGDRLDEGRVTLETLGGINKKAPKRVWSPSENEVDPEWLNVMGQLLSWGNRRPHSVIEHARACDYFEQFLDPDVSVIAKKLGAGLDKDKYLGWLNGKKTLQIKRLQARQAA